MISSVLQLCYIVIIIVVVIVRPELYHAVFGCGFDVPMRV